jgi:hypothetical protein
MKILLILGLPGAGKTALGNFLSTVLDDAVYKDLLNAKQAETGDSRPISTWAFTDHFTAARYLWEQWRKPSPRYEWLILTTPTRDYSTYPTFLPPVQIPDPPSPADAILLTEKPLSSYHPELPQDSLAKMLIKERQEAQRIAEQYSIPLLTITLHDQPIKAIWEGQINPWFTSLNTPFEPLLKDLPFSQEIQITAREADDETQKEMQSYLLEIMERDCLRVKWDTWKGIYLQPNPDEVPWTFTEFQTLIHHLNQHPNVISLDVPNSNLLGHAKSTG